MSTPEEQERIARNVQRTVGLHALRKLRVIVGQDLREEAARAKLLRGFLLYGWIILLLLAALLARHFGVF